MTGTAPKSQFARLVEQLGIELIAAHSPQAKGRIERLWQTFQDRLVKELRQAGATNLQEANQVLTAYLPKFNQRFMVAPAQPGAAFRPGPAPRDLDSVFSFHYQRQVANDHTISLDNHKLPLPPLAHGRSYARARVDLHHSMDGRLAVLYQGQLLTVFGPAEPGPPRVDHFCPKNVATPSFMPAKPVRSSGVSIASQPVAKPALNHPWRRYPVANKPAAPTAALPEQAAPAHPDIFIDRLP